MRVIRSDDEKVIAAQSNNSKYDYNCGESNFDYDFCVEYTFSDKKFMNELARDRVYGIANMRPIKRSKSVVKERLYQTAIEESSRMKTGGYYNELGSIPKEYCIHDTIPGRLKDKINDETVFQINDAIASNVMKQESRMKTEYHNLKQEHIKKVEYNNLKQEPIMKTDYNNINYEPRMKTEFSSANQFNMMPFDMQAVNNNPVLNNQVESSPYSKKNKKDMYEDIMDRVNKDLIDNSKKSDGNTKAVDSDRKKLRQEVGGKANNIPYKKTEIFEKGSNKGRKKEEGLVVRDCKSEKKGKAKSSGKKMAIGAWVISVMVMIASIAMTYLYMTGEISLELIKTYISKI